MTYNNIDTIMNYKNNDTEECSKFNLNMTGEEKYNILKNIFTEEKLNSELLKYEIEHIKNNTKTTVLKEFTEICKEELKRYQGFIGGKHIEDSEWIEHDFTSKRFKIPKDTIVLYNSIMTRMYNDLDTYNFLKVITKHLQKFSDTITIKNKIICDEKHDICWILLIIR